MSDPRKTVTQCVCNYKTFEQIKSIMHEKDFKTIRELIDSKTAGDSCGMCKPYLSNMIKTGEVSFKPGDIDPDYDEFE
jgi:bacterioferritin-associated ferredoxin